MNHFLIISDIHACEDDPTSAGAASYVSTLINPGRSIDPFSELEGLISEENLSIDFILCPGDITNRASKIPFTFAWDKLNALALRTNARLVATVGNHDVDSRYTDNPYDATEFAKSLKPTIPTDDRAAFLEFWAENFSIISSTDCNILTLNTAAYHGAGKDVKAETEYGRISSATLQGIRDALKRVPRRDTNILLCHHHLLKTDPTDTTAAGITRGGDALIDLLNDRPEAWIVVHGHRHIPELLYGHGGSNSPTILGCASFSAQINFDAQNKNPNQVHLLTCDPVSARAGGWVSAGQVKSWTWQPGIGWKRARGQHGLSYVSGFGFRSSVEFLARKIDSYFKENEIWHVAWERATSDIPSLLQLIPADFKALEAALQDRGITILSEKDGSLAQIGRST